MSASTFLVLFAALVAVGLVVLALIEVRVARCRERSVDRLAGEFAFHRHELRQMEARDEARQRAVLARLEEINGAMAARSRDA